MKIMIVTPYYYPKIGGLENYARQLGLSLRAVSNAEIVIITSNHHGRHTIQETVDGAKIYRLGTWFKLSNTPINPLWPLMMRRIIKRERPDVVHAHTPVPSLADAAALAAGRVPFVLTYHASTLLKDGHGWFNVLARAYRLYERLTLRKASQIVAVSDYVKGQLAERYRHKTVVIPNAIWEDEIATRPQPDSANFIFIGSLDDTHAWKGLELIIQAVGEYRQRYGDAIRLTVMGDGNQRHAYEATVRRLGLAAQITFVGSQTGMAKQRLLRSASALICYPTTANDAFPTVFLEAWANAVPVVAAAIGPIPSLIDDGVDGVLVEPHNPAALAEALHDTMARKSSRTHLARAALARTREYYTWERQGRAMSQVLEQLL